MNRRFFVLFALAAALIGAPLQSADARGGHGGGGCGHGGVGFGIGIGGYNDICGYAELYRQLYNNLPYFALHPPVYYSYPVPRTYGYSPFAYPPHVMTPDFVGAAQPLEIINPHVESTEAKPTKSVKPDRSAATSARAVPLVVINPFVAPNQAVARASH